MSRVFSDFPDRDEGGPEQSELLLPAGRREPPSGAPPSSEPARAEFFRAQRRPVLPLLGLVAAVATVAFFFWLGREETAPVQAVEGGELAPVAAAPGLEPALPAAAGLDAGAEPDPGALAPVAAPEPLPAVPSVLDARAAAPPPEAIPGEASPGASGFAVQLLAARSEGDVGASWERLRGSYPDLLAALTPSVTRTSRAPGETFFRLRAGPLRDRASADALCRELSLRQQSCFVVPPGS